MIFEYIFVGIGNLNQFLGILSSEFGADAPRVKFWSYHFPPNQRSLGSLSLHLRAGSSLPNPSCWRCRSWSNLLICSCKFLMADLDITNSNNWLCHSNGAKNIRNRLEPVGIVWCVSTRLCPTNGSKSGGLQEGVLTANWIQLFWWIQPFLGMFNIMLSVTLSKLSNIFRCFQPISTSLAVVPAVAVQNGPPPRLVVDRVLGSPCSGFPGTKGSGWQPESHSHGGCRCSNWPTLRSELPKSCLCSLHFLFNHLPHSGGHKWNGIWSQAAS